MSERPYGLTPPVSCRAVLVERLHEDVEIPQFATAGSAARDARAYLKGREVAFRSPDNFAYGLRAQEDGLFPGRCFVTLQPGHRALVPLGFKARIPEGYEVQVRPRSGLAWKHGITVLNAPGTIDEDYPGEWMVLLVNTSTQPFELVHGERIAQLKLGASGARWFDYQPVESIAPSTDRAGGFGSTGTA